MNRRLVKLAALLAATCLSGAAAAYAWAAIGAAQQRTASKFSV